ncbi:MAG TPA: hypothetical protein DCG12_04920 [Planctomycetaceae bacterium]|nr:hypothetical protein [Planctomycetaceae bacterium]
MQNTNDTIERIALIFGSDSTTTGPLGQDRAVTVRHRISEAIAPRAFVGQDVRGSCEHAVPAGNGFPRMLRSRDVLVEKDCPAIRIRQNKAGRPQCRSSQD